MKHRGTRGFTLLEMLVATTVMAIAVVGLLSALSTSIRNAGRLTNHDRAALVARRRMEELLMAARLPKMQVLEGPLAAATDAGLEGSWRARVTPFEVPVNATAGATVLHRIELVVLWREGEAQKTFALDGYKTEPIRPEDMQGLPR